MNVNVKKITITIDENEALSILNALRVGLDGYTKASDPESKGATDLAILLNANFFSSIKDVHFSN